MLFKARDPGSDDPDPRPARGRTYGAGRGSI